MFKGIRLRSGINSSVGGSSHQHSKSSLSFFTSRLSFRKPSLSPVKSKSITKLSKKKKSCKSNRRFAMDNFTRMLESLRENSDSSFVHLELEGSTIPNNYDPYELISAIRVNKTLRSVEISKEFLLDLTIDQGRNLFEAIGDLPHCGALFCDFPDPREGFPLQLHALTCVLTGSSPLQTISLKNLVLSRHEYEISEALQRHGHLREFQVKDLLLVDRNITLDPLLHALARIPTLKVVEIRMKHRQANALSLVPLRDICQSPSIRVLKFWQVKLTEELAVLMADALRGNVILRNLTLFDCALSRNGYVALAHMLKVNSTLQELQLYDESMDDMCCLAIAHGLEKNSTLRALTMQPLVPVYPCVGVTK